MISTAHTAPCKLVDPRFLNSHLRTCDVRSPSTARNCRPIPMSAHREICIIAKGHDRLTDRGHCYGSIESAIFAMSFDYRQLARPRFSHDCVETRARAGDKPFLRTRFSPRWPRSRDNSGSCSMPVVAEIPARKPS